MGNMEVQGVLEGRLLNNRLLVNGNFGYRDNPTSAGNPVFSVYQMDIIYYGYDLASYLEHEFDFRSYESLFSDEHPFRRIEFWSDVVG